ncbi:MAG: septal ring lytic transglycosylase RlpA family protein [Pseudomonadota bacterium]
MTHRLPKYFWLALFAVTLLINGCSHVHTKDGPPNFYVDETKIPNAVPKIERLSRLGNKPYYTVFGQRYYVMSTSLSYEERGIASWYGTKFHTRHTSNGERYDMLSMTAAHKTLPLPTYVLVTNLKNNKQVIVKVNDRGPFESNRLIDLSYVAAKKLGMLGHGTAYVDVKAIDPYTWNRPQRGHYHTVVVTKTVTTRARPRYYTAVPSSPSTSLYLQVGLFRHKELAERMRRNLMGMTSVPVNITVIHRVYHVEIGPFRDVASARRASHHLKLIGINNKTIREGIDIT